MAGLLDDLLARLDAMPAAARAEVEREVMASTSHMLFVPSEGPQTEAYLCQADELYYGGQAGGGKSALLIGLALNEHTNSLILRRVYDDSKDISKEAREFAGGAGAWNGQEHVLRVGDREIKFGGCQFEDDKERYKGRARDLYGFDEIGDFTETQYTFITTWNRSSKPGQRTRVVAAGNPPTRPEGLWVLKRWAAWLDKRHPRPAKPGELRWYTTDEDGQEHEVDGRGPHLIGGESLMARSRTFIPAKLDDNPFLRDTGYRASLDALPAHLRSAYRDGNFAAEIKDDANQLIPTEWVIAAMDRWQPDGFKAFTMTAIALDAAGGGADAAEIAARYGGWVSPFTTVRGAETNDGSNMAARIVMLRRDGCPVIVDSGGGYGGKTTERLKDNQIDAVAFVGSRESSATSNDAAHFRFRNKRAEVHWRLREALDPDQEGGSVIALPPDDEMKADLCAVHFWIERGMVQIESKDDIKSRIGRSPGKGDVVTMLFSEADKMVARARHRSTSGPRQTTADMGSRHNAVHARRRA